jgi:hypothetical protein
VGKVKQAFARRLLEMRWKCSVLLVLLLFCSAASAEILVTVSPKQPALETLQLYLDESAEYEITVLNSGPEAVQGIVLEANPSDGLKVLDQGLEKTVLPLKIESLDLNQKETFLLRVKPVELSAKKLFLYVGYGVRAYTHGVVTFLAVVENPLQVNASLSKTALDVGEEAFLGLSLKNNGPEPITNIKAELLAFHGLESMDGAVELASLAPGEGYEAKEMVFRADPSTSGKMPLVLIVSFEDSLGKHVLEKNFFVEIQSRETVLYLMAGIVVLLIVVALLSRKRDSVHVKKLEKPVVQEIEGSEVKPDKA